MPNTGKNIETILNVTAVPVSAVATMGFPNPPVFTVEANLVTVVIPCIAEAVPPPATIAKTHVMSGLTSIIV